MQAIVGKIPAPHEPPVFLAQTGEIYTCLLGGTWCLELSTKNYELNPSRFAVFQRPRVKSGKSAGRLRLRADCSERSTTLLQAAAS